MTTQTLAVTFTGPPVPTDSWHQIELIGQTTFAMAAIWVVVIAVRLLRSQWRSRPGPKAEEAWRHRLHNRFRRHRGLGCRGIELMAPDRDALLVYGSWERPRSRGLFGIDWGVRAAVTGLTVRLRVALARKRGQTSYRAELSSSAQAFLVCLTGGTTTDEEMG